MDCPGFVCLVLALASHVAVSQQTIITLDKPFGESCPGEFKCLDIWASVVSKRGTPWFHGNQPNSCNFFDGWVADRKSIFGQRAPKAAAVYRVADAALTNSSLEGTDTSPLTEIEVNRVLSLTKLATRTSDEPRLFDDLLDQYIMSKRKIIHDIEQLSFLLLEGKLPSCFWMLVQQYTEVLGTMKNERTLLLSTDTFEKIGWFYNSFLYLPTLPKVDRVISPQFEFKMAASQYHLNSPNFVVADNLLTAEALDLLMRFMWESTVWYEFRNGYFGAYFYDGFVHPILEQLVQELRAGFPDIIGTLPLVQQWAYKFDQNASAFQSTTGILPHADDALVNVNIWIVPDEANNDPSSGGMEIFLKEPDSFDYESHNNPQSMNFLDSVANTRRLKVSYKQNRIVMFKSTLIHSSDSPNFKPGYKSRRINLTFLFGSREGGCQIPSGCSSQKGEGGCQSPGGCSSHKGLPDLSANN